MPAFDHQKKPARNLAGFSLITSELLLDTDNDVALAGDVERDALVVAGLRAEDPLHGGLQPGDGGHRRLADAGDDIATLDAGSRGRGAILDTGHQQAAGLLEAQLL